MSPRPGLIPGTEPRSEPASTRASARARTSSRGVSTKPWTPRSSSPAGALRGGGEVTRGAAHADQPLARVPEPVDVLERLEHAATDPVQILLLGRSRARQQVLGQADGTERERAQILGAAIPDLDELHAAAAELDDDAVVDRGRVDGRDVAVARLLLLREHDDREARGLLGSPEELVPIRGVADRAGRDRMDVFGRQAVGLAEAPEHAQRLQASLASPPR